jgi:hypothetical protein
MKDELTNCRNGNSTLSKSVGPEFSKEFFEPYGVPKRAISLMWNQRSR